MAVLRADLNASLRDFDSEFDTSLEDPAAQARGEFLRLFPLAQLKNITIDAYAIGGGRATFCAYVEAKTRAWANIQGSNANKFGLYFGKTKSDPANTYRFTQKFGTNKTEAFAAIKSALLKLINAAEEERFADIDANPLSQMFKAKILSLYFPKKYLNICSAEHIELIASEFEISEDKFVSERQHLLLREKFKNPITRKWSNPKYMNFLYKTFIPKDTNVPGLKLKKVSKKKHRKVNLADTADDRDAIGKISEQFALDWEAERLNGLGYENLANRTQDCRDTPACGYDFLSHSAPDQKRYVEVKSAGRDHVEEGYRFFLSENQRSVSQSSAHKDQYYFYLVFYGKDGKPSHLKATKASELYASSDMSPHTYVLRFDVESITG